MFFQLLCFLGGRSSGSRGEGERRTNDPKKNETHDETDHFPSSLSTRVHSTETGWASCSIEGRIAVDYFSAEDQSKKYAYRCHRATVNGQDVVYPINALAYHPMFVHAFPSLLPLPLFSFIFRQHPLPPTTHPLLRFLLLLPLSLVRVPLN